MASRLEEYVELKDKFIDIKNKKIKAAENVLNDGFKEFFRLFPQLLNFSWYQFQPSFNDGDRCYFSVHCDPESITMKIKDEDNVWFLDRYGEATLEEGEDIGEDIEEKFGHIAIKISELLSKVDNEDFEDIYGEGVQITINKDGTIDKEVYYVD